MATIKLAYNAVVAKLVDAPEAVRQEVSNLLSYTVDGADHLFSVNSGSWNGISTFYETRNDTFPAGFVYMVRQKLKSLGHNVIEVRRPHAAPLGCENPIVDSFGNDDPRYDYQMKALRQVEKYGRGVIQVATGGGKCLGRDTPVMMYDGTIRSVQNVHTGDLLMGPDSKPRRVLSTCVGRAPLYKVTPSKGDPYIVNDAHILSLKKTSRGYRGRNRDGEKYPKGEIVNINVEEYLRKNYTFKHIHKGWRVGIDFPNPAFCSLDPYFLGLILGDGSISGTVSVTTADPEIEKELHDQAHGWGVKITGYGKTVSSKAKTYHFTQSRGMGPNPIMEELRKMGLSTSAEKHIPHHYRTASRQDRLKLLAGIIDTDGFWDGKGLYLTLKNERLMDDVVFVARSLGFAAYKSKVSKTCCNNGKIGVYFSTCITGDGIENIPVRLERRKPAVRKQKKDVLVHGITVEPLGEGDYFGFEIDGDHLFLLGDFTVTHNTKIAKLIMARFQRVSLFLTTRGILLYQMDDQLKEIGINTGQIGDGELRFVRGVNLGMVQTLQAAVKEPKLEEERLAVIKSLHLSKKKSAVTQSEIIELAKKRFDEKAKRRNDIIKLLELVEVVIGEEAHEAGGNSYYEVLRYCKNATVRVALTATPFMRDSAEDNMRLMAAFGPKLIIITEQMLIDRGILAKPYFKIVDSRPHPQLRRTSPWQRAYQLGYMENTFMLEDMLVDAKNAQKYGLPTMTLVQRTEHGEKIRNAYEEAGLRVSFIRGANNQEERKREIAKLSKREIDVLIGTNILDVGVDVPAVGLLQIAGGGKAEVAMRQRIGRSLRSKKHMPNFAFVADYTCNLNATLKEHAQQRLGIIRRTPGFVEGILPAGQDFDWSIFAKAAQ